MIGDKVIDLGVEPVEDCRVGGDKGGLVAVAASEVLRSNDADRIAFFGTNQQNLAVIVGKICPLNNLGDERPQFERLVGRLMVEYEIDARHTLIVLGGAKRLCRLCDKE